VQALPDHRGHILSPRGQRRRVVDLPGGRRVDLGVDRHDEGEGLGVILDDEDRPRRLIETLDDAVQVDEGRLTLHGRPQPDVVAMVQIGAAIAVAEEASVGEAVVVGALPASRCAANGDRRRSTRCRPVAVTAGEDRGVERSDESERGDTRQRPRPVASVERAPP
jgi:hypothetical protein